MISIITAYCSCAVCCGSTHLNLNAAGNKPKEGTSIAAPRSIPLGTKVVIEHHTYIVDDRTARRFDGRFDIYFSSHKKALEFGKQKLEVTILKP